MLAIGFVVLGVGQAANAQAPTAPISDFADYLVSRDLVVRGALLEKQKVLHSRASTQGVSGLTPVAGWMLSISPDSVLFGSLADTVLRLFVWGTPDYEEGSDSPGQLVIAYGLRPSSDWS